MSRVFDEIGNRKNRSFAFKLVVIDVAHKLRNAYRPGNKMGQNIKWAVEELRVR